MAKSVLGSILRDQRKFLGLTQKQVAVKMGVSVRTFQRLEIGASMKLYDDAFRVLDMKIIVLPKALVL